MVLLMVMLTQNWLRSAPHSTLRRGHERSYSFQIINNLLRVARNGQEIKSTVDYFLEKASEHLDLTNSILQYRADADDSSANQAERVAKGLLNLRRYWWLLLLAIYFQDVPPTTDTTFEQWVDARPVFKTLEREFDGASLHALTPLGARTDHVTQSNEMQKAIASRKGRILTAQTILKSDFFSGLQKKSLPEQIEGAPNFRRVTTRERLREQPGVTIYGVGMPTIDGLRHAWKAIHAAGDGNWQVTWTSVRGFVAPYQWLIPNRCEKSRCYTLLGDPTSFD
jgi:hypothetical protein